jgi:hypothetical protein
LTVGKTDPRTFAGRREVTRFRDAFPLALMAVGALLMSSCSPSLSGSATPTPSSAAPTDSASPSVEPTPGVSSWTGLDWALASVDNGSCWAINDIVPWRDGYVGVGSSGERSGGNCVPTSQVSPAFFASADGLHWTLAQTEDPVPDASQGGIPERLVSVGDSLLAMDHPSAGAPQLWRTNDGSTWSPLDSPTWRNIWLPPNQLTSIAAGPTGLVAVGEVKSDCCTWGPAVIVHSADGLTWDRLDSSSAFNRAYLSDVTAYAGGFVIVGHVGEKEVLGGPPAVGKPAAWTSADGVTWVAAEVEGSEAPDASLFTVVAGADGLFATGYTNEFATWQSPRSGWASTNGRSWQLLGEMGSNLPLAIDLPLAMGFPTDVVGDATHMVMFGRESCKTAELSAWTSLDGMTWTELAFSGATATLPTVGPICNDDGTEGSSVGSLGLANAFVLPGGVFVVASSSAPAAPTYWFVTATTN